MVLAYGFFFISEIVWFPTIIHSLRYTQFQSVLIHFGRPQNDTQRKMSHISWPKEREREKNRFAADEITIKYTVFGCLTFIRKHLIEMAAPKRKRHNLRNEIKMGKTYINCGILMGFFSFSFINYISGKCCGLPKIALLVISFFAILTG